MTVYAAYRPLTFHDAARRFTVTLRKEPTGSAAHWPDFQWCTL